MPDDDPKLDAEPRHSPGGETLFWYDHPLVILAAVAVVAAALLYWRPF